MIECTSWSGPTTRPPSRTSFAVVSSRPAFLRRGSRSTKSTSSTFLQVSIRWRYNSYHRLGVKCHPCVLFVAKFAACSTWAGSGTRGASGSSASMTWRPSFLWRLARPTTWSFERIPAKIGYASPSTFLNPFGTIVGSGPSPSSSSSTNRFIFFSPPNFTPRLLINGWAELTCLTFVVLFLFRICWRKRYGQASPGWTSTFQTTPATSRHPMQQLSPEKTLRSYTRALFSISLFNSLYTHATAT